MKRNQALIVLGVFAVFLFLTVAALFQTLVISGDLKDSQAKVSQLETELEASEQKYDELLASTELADKGLELMKETDILGSLDNATELAETFQDVDVSGHSEELQKYVDMYKELQEAN